MTPQTSRSVPDQEVSVSTQIALLNESVKGLREDLTAWISRIDTANAEQRARLETLRDEWMQSDLKGKVDGLDKRVVALEKTIPEIKPAIDSLKWVATVVGALIVGLLWAVVTGQARVMFGS